MDGPDDGGRASDRLLAEPGVERILVVDALLARDCLSILLARGVLTLRLESSSWPGLFVSERLGNLVWESLRVGVEGDVQVLVLVLLDCEGAASGRAVVVSPELAAAGVVVVVGRTRSSCSRCELIKDFPLKCPRICRQVSGRKRAVQVVFPKRRQRTEEPRYQNKFDDQRKPDSSGIPIKKSRTPETDLDRAFVNFGRCNDPPTTAELDPLSNPGR